MQKRELAKMVESQEPLGDYSPDRLAAEGAWRPQTIRDVEWALECVAESDAEMADIDAQLRDVIARAENRAKKLKAAAERRAGFFRGAIATFAEQIKADFLVGKAKSRRFLSGTVGWRKHGGRLKVEDKDQLVAWLEHQPDATLYRIKVEPEMKELQEHCKRTGEVPPGCTYSEERDEVYVEATQDLLMPKGGM